MRFLRRILYCEAIRTLQQPHGRLYRRLSQNTILRTLYFLYAGRGKISYSQFGEDLILDQFFRGKKRGMYVDVGACHPTYLSNTYRFYRRGWSGINIEPNRRRWRLFTLFRRRDVNLQVGICNRQESATFYVFDSEVLSTFSAESAARTEHLGHRLRRKEQVQLVSLASVLEQHAAGRTIDFLSVDTEGYELEVLRSNDWERFRPSIIVLETTRYDRVAIFAEKTDRDSHEYLRSLRYKKIADTYLNSLYADEAFIANARILST